MAQALHKRPRNQQREDSIRVAKYDCFNSRPPVILVSWRGSVKNAVHDLLAPNDHRFVAYGISDVLYDMRELGLLCEDYTPTEKRFSK